ncbi:MAG: hypothetical protein Q8L27_00170 [archaeon]|nr:hypothetical protein [archaeon]
MNKNKKLIFGMILLATALFLIANISAASNYCCEKTVNGAFCQNAPIEQCDNTFKTAPTSCDSTSYCKKGCCFDGNEGLCMEGTPQRVCETSGGTWADDEQCNVPQCELGCCVLADQGAFVTLTRCKQMSGFYGIKTDFRKTIGDELTCIATAQKADKGACVFEDVSLLKKKCTFTTRDQCKTANLASDVLNNTNSTLGASSGFYKDYLCTAPELGTECAPDLKNTITVDGKDEVYFKDTCGNVANIYDADRAKDKAYWTKVYSKSESCGYGSSNAGSSSCGNCDYYLGSIAKKSTGILGGAQYGDYVCSDLGCKKENRQHGESWCVSDSPNGDGEDTVGSRFYREICMNGEVITEPCADFRNEVCIEDDFDGFSEAQCRINKWQDCTQQQEEKDCSNVLVRNCKWVEGYYFSTVSGQIEKSADEDSDNPTPKGLCVPNNPPGFNFWTTGNTGTGVTTPEFTATTPAFGTGYVDPASAGTAGESMCGLGNTKVTLKWEKQVRPADFLKIFGGDGEWVCANDECERYDSDPSAHTISDAEAQTIANDLNAICSYLGDCGGKSNFVGKSTDDGYAAYVNNERVAGSGNAEVIEKVPAAVTTTTNPAKSATGDNVGNALNVVNTGAQAYNSVAGSGSSTSGTVAAVISENENEEIGFFTLKWKIISDYFKNKIGEADE